MTFKLVLAFQDSSTECGAVDDVTVRAAVTVLLAVR
jgi:hypothetical protein